jgi:hypothetical protein
MASPAPPHILATVIGRISMRWIEAVILPVALISIPLLMRCYRRWNGQEFDDATQELATSEAQPPTTCDCPDGGGWRSAPTDGTLSS